MDCPNCGNSNTIVKTSRAHRASTIRQRECNVCKNIFYTKESVIDYTTGQEAIAEFYKNYRHSRKNKKS